MDMIYIIHNGRPHPDDALRFVAAPDDFGAWFDETYRPWADGAEEHPVRIVGGAPKVEWREDPLSLGMRQPGGFSTISVNQFLRSDAIIQLRDGTTRPSYRLERFRIVTKRIRIRANSKTAKSVKAIARLVGAGAPCIPRWIGGRVLFEHSKKLPGLIGSVDCDGEWASLLLHSLTVGEAASALQTLVFMRTHGKR
jgi:hypothetical protein